ncbi:MAG: hypothetical protein ACYTEQ_06605 [Planctomycetota bacterium]
MASKKELLARIEKLEQTNRRLMMSIKEIEDRLDDHVFSGVSECHTPQEYKYIAPYDNGYIGQYEFDWVGKETSTSG